MKILMFVNWNVLYCEERPLDKQPPDYYIKGEDYWFFRYFKDKPEVDVIDTHSFPWLEKIEKNKIRFYIWQTLKILPRLWKYDLIISHGMQSGIVLSLFRRVFPKSPKHIVFDIGSFNSAAETGFALKLMQFASKSINGVIYHTSNQMEYYKEFFPWIVEKSQFMLFGTDKEFFNSIEEKYFVNRKDYIVCIGYNKRDWDTLCKAYASLDTQVTLRLIGNKDYQCENANIEVIPSMSIHALMKEIQGALFCVLPLQNFNYSFGQMTLLQQMAMGKAVIVAKVHSMVDYVKDKENVLLYEAENVSHLYEKMKMLLEDKNMCVKLGSQAKEYIQNENNEEIMAGLIEAYLEKVGQE
ncbi:MAG: glycosyltransferase family 4 protein [Eubacteriales bacterium]